ncbi:hypothetical protein BVC80_8587g2 [Macleaya cordata]|uniref:Uncharacterized protein n=1 Tax=Macleaya cordata TaxID=56857 RepID=A0A200RAG9_MACCD|nr:hypothetical protein BVC80_8587g2 [Macleaya cordata]
MYKLGDAERNNSISARRADDEPQLSCSLSQQRVHKDLLVEPMTSPQGPDRRSDDEHTRTCSEVVVVHWEDDVDDGGCEEEGL